jgi:hypothetical protein
VPAPAIVVKPAPAPPAPAIVVKPAPKAKRRSRTESTDTLAWWMKWGDGISDNEPREMTLPCYEFDLSTDAPPGAAELLRYGTVSELRLFTGESLARAKARGRG